MSNFPRYLSLAIGFLSLSQEILWVRLISFVHEMVPQSFAFVLTFYLLGIAIGAHIGKRICAAVVDLYGVAFLILLAAGILDALLPLSVVFLLGTETSESLELPMLLLATLHQAFAITVTSLLKSIIFPIAHHLGTVERDGKLGSSVSKVYFFNIVGSTLGPIVTGFYLLNALDLQSCFLLMAAMTLLVASACWMKSLVKIRFAMPAAAVLTVGVLTAFSLAPEMLVTQIISPNAMSKIKHVIQNRHGIIHTIEGGARGDMVYGGNTYDGRFNTSLVVNSNGINRAYMLATLIPRPKRVLMIGLSSASWLKVVSGIEGVEALDVVEINPGYVELLERYSGGNSLLKDRRIHLHIDDGRRWLKLHPDARYDLIVMNTTFHWKNFISNLLSLEFIELVKKHLNPDGALYYNSTGSNDVLKTAGSIFRYAYRYSNFVIASDRDVRMDVNLLRDRVYTINLDGQPALVKTREADQEAVMHMLAMPLISWEQAQAGMERPLEVITDQNMITEFKYGRNF